MKINLIIIVTVICCTNGEKSKINPTSKAKPVKTTSAPLNTVISATEAPTEAPPSPVTKPSVPDKVIILPEVKHQAHKEREHRPIMIPPSLVQEWASEIAGKLLQMEKQVVRRDFLLKSFSGLKTEVRNGPAIVAKMASALEDLLQKRAQAAASIGAKAEALEARETDLMPYYYKFDLSNQLDLIKKEDKRDPKYPKTEPMTCKHLNKWRVEDGTHFGDATVCLNISSVHMSAEVFACDERILSDIYWTEGLLPTFKRNYAVDASMDFQYFCSAKGFLRHYPAAVWGSMFQLQLNPTEDEEDVGDVYDCRLRPWYVAASGAPRDVLILLDATGSMTNSSNLANAEQFTLALLSALTDDDQVNVLRFNRFDGVQSPISCFNNKLVPANHVNSAAMMSALKRYPARNQTNVKQVLEEAVRLLTEQQNRTDRPPSCQQAIVLLIDSLELNLTDYIRQLDPSGNIRVFVIWLHDPYGIRDSSRDNSGWLSCSRDGCHAELVSNADVTEQVMRILRTLERPLVAQRKERPRVFSDVYAHVEDPRRSEYQWHKKENAEQAYRYQQLRLNKKKLLSAEQLYNDWMYQQSLDTLGHYYEGQDVDYRLMISVSVPVFDATTTENITIKLNEEKQRNSTRTYPVNRLLGVAGVDIPIDRLKLIFPYYQLGAGGSLFLIDHRGNIVLHDNTKPIFDGNILKPGYRTVDILDLEQPGNDNNPREYSLDWLEFRKVVVIQQPVGNRTMFGRHVFEGGMRAILELREYHWRRVMHHYTAVVALPKYGRRYAVLEGGAFTQQLALKAISAFSSELSVHPDWLYCRHIDPYFDEPESEVRHFIKRRGEEPDFQMKNLKHRFSPIKFITLLEKPYQCNEDLIARLCKEVLATQQWAAEHQEEGTERDCTPCVLGSVTAFFASESGLTRWQQYHAIGEHAAAPAGGAWPRGPAEAWYRRAAAAPDKLVVHAPVAPIRKRRNSDQKAPPLGTQYEWLTAARTLSHPEKGLIGVAGYHFHPAHLEDLLKSTTYYPECEEGEVCQPRCEGEDWTCVIVDEGAWIVAGYPRENEDITEEGPIREHLARLHPQAMYALLTANVFKLHWIHDYQGVCFPSLSDSGVATAIPSILRSLWRSVHLIFHVTREVITILSILSSGSLVGADTAKEREKRRNRTRRDYERERYDRLFDERVCVNRTRFAACDRSRPFYTFQHSQRSLEALRRPAAPCSWPLVGALIPKTNLLLLAIYNHCKHDGRPVPDPLDNIPVNMGQGAKGQQDTLLACWRNRATLEARRPHYACYPHNYSQEEGYRQCGPWLPDPEEGEVEAAALTGNAGSNSLAKGLLCVILVSLVG